MGYLAVQEGGVDGTISRFCRARFYLKFKLQIRHKKSKESAAKNRKKR